MIQLKNFDEVKNLRDLKDTIKTIEKVMRFTNLSHHVIIDGKIGDLFEQGIVEKTQSWCRENCVGRWDGNGIIFLFEFEEDAMAFKLRWI